MQCTLMASKDTNKSLTLICVFDGLFTKNYGFSSNIIVAVYHIPPTLFVFLQSTLLPGRFSGCFVITKIFILLIPY